MHKQEVKMVVKTPKATRHPQHAAPSAYTHTMTVSIASQKGGTGKTTTAVTLAAGLARRGDRVLVVDMDHQANASKVLLPNYPELRKEQTVYVTILQRQPLPVQPSSIPNLDIVPSHILLSNTDMELTVAKDHREARVKRELDKIRDQYDYILFDCPPALSWQTINAFTASDGVLVVVSPGYFELDSIVQIGRTIAEVQEFYNPNLRILGYLFTRSDATNNSAVSLRILRQTYTGQVLRTIIPSNTDIRDAHFSKQDIFAYNPQSKSAQAYHRLIEELFA
jgi:chromosome partitioning protein